MSINQCPTCRGVLERRGNYNFCLHCGNTWIIDVSDDIHAVSRANAWESLREGDFEKAIERFENILAKDEKNHEAYWGRALATNGILYVDDLDERKKVATCNNITEHSFIKNHDVEKAISLAPREIAESYQAQAEYIERVRIEWLEKARKEPPYDIFISFKDKDRERGKDRTQDSYDAHNLYNVLTQQGYKVFFSRVSLRDKVSEHYEPYIYNALKTAKVMIVFGEKPEYFSSTWVKNEWSRFASRIKNGEKHKNSLVVVYKNMEPGDLPAALRSRQCLDANDFTFLQTLERHIKRVINESASSEHLEKINISGGQIAKKATTLSVNTVRTREIGEGAIAETSISEKQTVDLIYTYLSESQWDSASNLIEDVLFSNPGCAEALWCRLLVNHKAKDDSAITNNLDRFGKADYEMIEKILNCASKAFAEKILMLLYQSEKNVNDDTYHHILTTILPFSFGNRKVCLDHAFDDVIHDSKYKSFQLLLSTLQSDEVNRYISFHLLYAGKTTVASEKTACFQNVLNVDEGNVSALRGMVQMDVKYAKDIAKATQHFETLLGYSPNPKQEVIDHINLISKNISIAEEAQFVKQILRYYDGTISDFKAQLIDLSNRMVAKKLFKSVEYFLNLILSFDPENPDVYWNICLMKIGVGNESQIINSNYLLKKVPEFNKYLTFCTEQRRKECIQLAKAQEQKCVDLSKTLEVLREARSSAEKKLKKYRSKNIPSTVGRVMLTISLALILGLPAVAILAAIVLAIFDALTNNALTNNMVEFVEMYGVILIVGASIIAIVSAILLKLFGDYGTEIKKCQEEIEKIDQQISELTKSNDPYQSKRK